MTEEEEKEKFEKEDLPKMELEGKKVATGNKLKQAQKELEKIKAAEEKDPDAPKEAEKKKILEASIPKLAEEKAELDATEISSKAEVDAEVTAKVK